MKILKLAKKNLDLFVSVLPAFGEVYAPIKRGNSFVFDKPGLWSDVQMNYTRTILPPKKLLLPPCEATFTFDPNKGYQDLLNEASKPMVLFGVHAYDIYGLNILDRVFVQGKYPDPYYIARRRATTIIGVDFVPDDKHAAGSMNADFVDQGFDLFLSDIGDEYLVLVGTSRGDDIVVMSGCLLQTPTQDDFAEYKRRSKNRHESYKVQLDLEGLPEILEMEYHSKAWDDFGKRCLSCGSCSMVCPTCYCFDVKDEVDLGGRTGKRIRTWDSCLLRTHALVAGGENFREDRASRVKHRFYHKQRGFVAEYGRPSCVGCGRCVEVCPVDINIISVIETIRGERDGIASSAPASA
ncbi:MAG: 4Fe-4S dicluster domain-containing protein [Acidobacteria bacterium]|nr:4Fe-4S dicluster domain-containing protein [Acidobacteriota bacterium]